MALHSRSRSEQARDWLRQRIVSGEWELNARVPSEMALAEQLGVSRGTIREAVRALIELGMLESAVGRGTFVRSRTPDDRVLKDLLRDRGPAECLELRAAIEADAARRLATLHDPGAISHLIDVARPREDRERVPGEFHVSLVEAGCAQLSVSMHAALLGAIREFLATGRVAHALDDERRLRDHERIVDSIRAGDAAEASERAAQHALGDFTLAGSPAAFPTPGLR
ncbi:MAG: FadR/GntR family transcriptional regulator [Leucobacter sp.]